MSGLALVEDELSTSHTGPKGVINDWRKFKLESLDRDGQPPSKRELLRQMSSPNRSKGDSRETPNRKMNMQEYKLIKDEDEQFLRKYRKQCMQEMHERLSFGPRFERLYELESGEAFLDAIEKEHRLTVVVVHIYKDSIKGCETLNHCLTYLAAEYPSVKFCKIKASSTGASDRFSDNVLPALLVYKAGELLGNFLCATQQLNAEFHAIDVEAFLNEYGLLPTKYLTAEVKDEEEADVE
ncbi:phosducin b isoform X2 [Brienomyrus brachyistius]|nr:phosducin b isoform X2 [Brienomyrus brachyistius]